MKHTFEATDTDLVRTGFEHLYEVYEKIDPKGAHLLEESEPYVLTYLDFPKEHAHWIRTNNLCERLNKEIKKRTRVVGVFPLKQAMLRLVGAVCINQNEEWFVARISWTNALFSLKNSLRESHVHKRLSTISYK